MRKNHLILKTILNQQTSIQIWKELEVAEKAARIAENIDWRCEDVCPDQCTCKKAIAQKIREDLGLPSYIFPTLYEVVNESGV